WTTPSASSSGVARKTCAGSYRKSQLVQREHEHVARILEAIELHRMQVPAARLHREVLFGPDRVGDGRAFERRADVEAPELLERVVVVGDHPSVLQRGKDETARGVDGAGANLDVGEIGRAHV